MHSQKSGPAVLFAGLLVGLPLFAQEKVNYADHLLPLIEANCAKCHNSDKKKADLDLTSFSGAIKGSGSGPIVISGNPDGSKLWKALTHAEEPFMPPNRPKLADKELDLFKKWIQDGLLETAGGKAIAATKPGLDLALKLDALAKPQGPPPMPKELPLEPVVHTGRGGAIEGLAASPWAPLVAVAGQKQVLLFQTETLELLGILPFDEGQPLDLKFSRNGKLLLAGGGRGAKSGRVVVWDIVTGERLMTLGQEYDSVLAADIRPDQSQVALGGPSRLVKLLSTKTGELQQKIKKHTDWVTAVAYSPDGHLLATADRNGGISLWDPDSAQELFTLAGHKSAVTALSWRPDSKLLASASEDGTVKLWETKEGKPVKSWAAHPSGTRCVNYAPDGHLVTCGRDNAVILWDGNGSKLRAFEFFGNIPLRATFSQDSARVIATDFAGRVAVWTVADGKRAGELDANPLPLTKQVVTAQQRVDELQARATNTLKAAETNLVQARAEAQDPVLVEAKALVTRLQSAQLLTDVYRLRASLSAKKQAEQRLSASLQANIQASQQAEKALKAARQAALEAQAQIKTAKADAARGEPALKQITSDLQAEQLLLDRLLHQYEAAKKNPAHLAEQSVH